MNANSSKWGIPGHLRIVGIVMGILCITAAVIMAYYGKTMSIGNISIAADLAFLVAGSILIIASLVGYGKKEDRQSSVRVWHILLLVLVVLLIIYVSTHYTFPEANKYDILRDLILITLGFAAAAGSGIYLLIRRNVETRAKEISVESNNVTSAAVHTSLGFAWYQHYMVTVQARKDTEKTKQKKSGQSGSPTDKAMVYLGFAITETRVALEYANKLDERTQEELICTCKNNLAYYLAEINRVGKERVSAGDKKLALAYADYIHKAIGKYPDRREAWSDTCDVVKSQFAPQGGVSG